MGYINNHLYFAKKIKYAINHFNGRVLKGE